jgi:hypothetical protein
LAVPAVLLPAALAAPVARGLTAADVALMAKPRGEQKGGGKEDGRWEQCSRGGFSSGSREDECQQYR